MSRGLMFNWYMWTQSTVEKKIVFLFLFIYFYIRGFQLLALRRLQHPALTSFSIQTHVWGLQGEQWLKPNSSFCPL